MKTFIFTDDYEDAYGDSSCEMAARVFLTGNDETLRVSNELMILAAQVLVAEGEAKPFQVRFQNEIFTCDEDGIFDKRLPAAFQVYVTLGQRYAVILLDKDKKEKEG